MTKSDEKVAAVSDHESVESDRSTLNFFAKVGYGVGHVFNDLCLTVWFSYTLLFLKDVLMMPNVAGSLITLGQITDAVFSAIIGYLTDRYSTKRNWHIMGTVIVALSFPMLFLMQRNVLPYWGNVFYFVIVISLFQCGWATVQISHLAILPEISTTQTDRSELNSSRYCMSIFSNITVFVVAWMVLHISNRKTDEIGPDDFDKFRNIAIFIMVIGLLATIIFQVSLSVSKYSKRRQEKLTSADAVESLAKPSSGKVFDVLKNVELYKVAFLYTFSRLFLVICTVYIPIWLNDFMKTKTDQSIDNIAVIPLIFFVASFVAAFLLKYINQKISHKVAYCIGSLVSISGCVWITFSSSLEAIELFGMAILLGTGSSITQISSLCICADMIGEKSENGGLIYSIVTFCDKLFSGIIIFVIEALERNQSFYTDVLIFNGFTAILGLLMLATFRNKKS